MRTLLIMAVFAHLLQGCVFVGSRQELSQDPVQFLDQDSRTPIREVLIVPRYTLDDQLVVAKPFIYKAGDKLNLVPPESSGIILGTTFVGKHKGLDGFVVFAHGYRPRWGGMGTREYFDKAKRETVVVREVLMEATQEEANTQVSWLAAQSDIEVWKIPHDMFAVFSIAKPFDVANKVDAQGRLLLKAWAASKPESEKTPPPSK